MISSQNQTWPVRRTKHSQFAPNTLRLALSQLRLSRYSCVIAAGTNESIYLYLRISADRPGQLAGHDPRASDTLYGAGRAPRSPDAICGVGALRAIQAHPVA